MTYDRAMRVGANLADIVDLPDDWAEQISRVGAEFGHAVRLAGDSPDSREPSDSVGTEYQVVTGDTVAAKVGWLMDAYTGPILEFANSIAERQLVPASNIRQGVNINILSGVGGRYEWHVDPCPVSAVLFVTAHPPGHGGELALREDGELVKIYPTTGLIVAFEGRKIEHAVLPLMRDSTRISVPMIYYRKDDEQYFPPELDSYLYGGPTAARKDD